MIDLTNNFNMVNDLKERTKHMRRVDAMNKKTSAVEELKTHSILINEILKKCLEKANESESYCILKLKGDIDIYYQNEISKLRISLRALKEILTVVYGFQCVVRYHKRTLVINWID